MRLVFLGTGGYHPNERRHTLSVMLPEIGLVFDAGTGFFRASGLLETRTLDIFLSHAHLDHVVGLPWLLVPLNRGDLERVRIHGPVDTLQAVREHLLAAPLFPVELGAEFGYEFVPLTEQVPVGRGGVLRHVVLNHPGGSVGYRIDWPDRSLACITDTSPGGDYVEFLRGVDLLVHECNFPDDATDWAIKTGHSHTGAVAQLARDAQVGRLVLTHFDAERLDDDPVGIAAARTIFPRTELSEDLMVVEF